MRERLEKLVAAGIRLVPVTGIESHFVFEREQFVALVERREAEFGEIGSAGRLTDRGFEALVWRGGAAYFVAKGFEEQASAADVERLRSFSADLREALK